MGPPHGGAGPGVPVPHRESSGPAHHCPSARKTPSPEVQPLAELRHYPLPEAGHREPVRRVKGQEGTSSLSLSLNPHVTGSCPGAHLTFWWVVLGSRLRGTSRCWAERWARSWATQLWNRSWDLICRGDGE